MSSPIERVRYYEGEYLGSGDFDAEQAYHIEMRRRMNHALHLSGIVYGLELKQVDEGAGIFSYNIGKGLAIDHEGREIFLFSARQIDATDLQRNLIGSGGDYRSLGAVPQRSGCAPFRRLRPVQRVRTVHALGRKRGGGDRLQGVEGQGVAAHRSGA